MAFDLVAAVAGIVQAPGTMSKKRKRIASDDAATANGKQQLKLIQNSCPVIQSRKVEVVKCDLFLELFGCSHECARSDVMTALSKDASLSSHIVLAGGPVGRLAIDAAGVARLLLVGGVPNNCLVQSRNNTESRHEVKSPPTPLLVSVDRTPTMDAVLDAVWLHRRLLPLPRHCHEFSGVTFSGVTSSGAHFFFCTRK